MAKPGARLSGSIHFIAKGDVELPLGDETLGYHDSRKGMKYFDAVTRPYRFNAGYIVFFRIRSTVVIMPFIMALESKDGNRFIPVKSSDFRYLGPNIGRDDFSLGEILSLDSPLEVGSGGSAMKSMWGEHAFPQSVRERCDWIKLPSKGEWHTFALGITPNRWGGDIFSRGKARSLIWSRRNILSSPISSQSVNTSSSLSSC